MPAKFDPSVFAQEILDPLRVAVQPFLGEVTEQAKRVVAQLDALEGDVGRTLDALEKASSDEERYRLKDDLTKYLPARKTALLAEIVSLGASDAEAIAETALNVVVKAAVAAARAFVPIP